MRAVVYDRPEQFSVREIPTPAPGPLDVLIRVHQVGVCGTDLHLHHGEFRAVYPLIPGHEMVGTVVEVGADVTRVRIGEQVTVNPNIPCGRCSYCLSGRVGICPDSKGHGSNHPGFFAEFACVPETLVFSVDGMDPDTAVFVEPASCALHGLETLAVRPGSTALVIGAGPTGQLLAQLIASGGASSVTVADRVPFKLETARQLGATATVLVGDDAGSQLRQASPDGDGYDIVVEATGVPAVGDLCVPLARNGGTVLVYGVAPTDAHWRISPYDIFRREITLKGSFAEMTTFGATVAALRAGRLRTDGLITHRFPLDAYGEALDTLAHGTDAHKVVLTL